MNKIIVSIVFLLLVGCGGNPTKPPHVTPPLPPSEVAKCIAKPSTALPEYLDVNQYKMEDLGYTDGNFVLSRQEFIRIQDLLLALKNRIYELQKIVEDSKK